MKIIIDARLYGLENAGLGRYVMNLISELEKGDNNNEYILLLRKKYFNELKCQHNFRKVLADFRHYSIKEQIILPRILLSHQPDIVHFPHFNVPIFYRGKYIVTIHDLLMHKQKGFNTTTLNPLSYLLKRLAYKYVFTTAVRNSIHLIVPTNSVKEEVLKNYKIPKNKISVIYEGFNLIKKSSHKHNLEKPYFLYVGNAYPHKNLKRVIEATIQINQKLNKKICFAIVSSRSAFTKKLQNEIKHLNAENYVKLLGFVSDEELTNLYENSVAFIYPSLMEGFGLPGLEAMSAGTLVLASEIPVFKEVYKDNVLYFNPYDFTSIERSMRSAINIIPSERKSRIAKSKKFIQKYSWQKMARETLQIYENSDRI